MIRMADREVEDVSVPIPECGCWIFEGCLNRGQQYGQIRVEGRVKLAHRWAYEKKVGPIPEGLYVCHKCDTPACINPDHMFIGTGADNIRDMHSKMRSSITRMTPAQVLEATELRKSGFKWRELGAKYGVATSSIAQRISGRGRKAGPIAIKSDLNPE